MGCYWTVRRLAKAGLIPEMYIERCSFCNKNTPDTIEHMLIECFRWNSIGYGKSQMKDLLDKYDQIEAKNSELEHEHETLKTYIESLINVVKYHYNFSKIVDSNKTPTHA
ncbi:hypothetical protein BB560_003214 [Smittium megazygosporum]|uniref:Uncharacterized protein n=1 Tax=Smittium megazygosporum TaxID=133381 RepID=A0A2T9ZCP1_9FUNG|nr:hypothetical protein BB560_003214 [Smittium megazygosporum]